MAMAATVKLVLGSIAFAIFWVLAVFPAVPFLPIGRTAGSLLGAMLMVLFQVMTPDQAYAAIDLPILGLLFGTMVVSVFLERADMFKYIGKLLSWKSKGAKDLLCRICLISAISSALFTNDTSCVVLTEFVLKMARQHNLPPHPFLLALASSANIGSSATPIGNPQNLVIAIQSKISFGRFLFGILPAMLVGVCVNALILLCMYWKVLSDQNDEDDAMVEVVVGEDNAVSHQFSPAAMSHVASLNLQELNSTIESVNIRSCLNNGDTDHVGPTLENRGNLAENNSIQTSPSVSDHTGHTERIEEGIYFSGSEPQNVTSSGIESTRNLDSSKEVENYGSTPSKRSSSVNGIICHNFQKFVEESLGISKKWKRVIWKACVYTITLGMLVSLLMGFNMSWTAITTALVLLVLDFKDARPCLEKVSYLLLIFFCGMFITIDGFDRTGLPSTLWEFVEPHAKVNQTGGIALLAAVIIVLSNLVSNVPTVLLLGARVAASAAAISPESERKAWLVLAWVSTVAGNLSLLGSAANLIVCEQARRAQQNGFNLSFWSHLKFGVASTFIVTAVGLALVRG